MPIVSISLLLKTLQKTPYLFALNQVFDTQTDGKKKGYSYKILAMDKQKTNSNSPTDKKTEKKKGLVPDLLMSENMAQGLAQEKMRINRLKQSNQTKK
jgi:hypothetical protein